MYKANTGVFRSFHPFHSWNRHMEKDSTRPPTLNFLGPFQRSRLLKSSRKIEYLLGATPHVLEPSDFAHQSHHDHVDGHALDSAKLRRFKSKRRQPARLHLSPVSPPDDLSTADQTGGTHHRIHASDLPSPLPLTVPAAHSSARIHTLTADHHEDTVTSRDRLHRKQMAKLTRVLGENIPPELVRRQSVRTAHTLQPDHADHAPPASSGSRQWLSDGDGTTTRHPRRGRRSLSHSSSPTHQPRLASPSTSPPLPYLNFTTSHPPQPQSYPGSSSRRYRAARGDERSSPRAFSGYHSPTSLEGPQISNGSSSGSQSITYSLLAHDKRAEARWNGEWSVQDAETRATALRNLRT